MDETATPATPMAPVAPARPDTCAATADAHEGATSRRPRDWAWRRRLRERRATYQAYRMGVALLGLSVVVIGLILVPLPGPGWLIVFLGFGILASEFHWARRLHAFASVQLRRWNDWILAQSWPVRLACAAATGLFVGLCFWVLFKIAGLPGFFPEWITQFLRTYLAL